MTETQADMFDPQAAHAEKVGALDRVADNAGGWLDTIRAEAKRIATTLGTVTVDDLQAYAAANRMQPHHQNAWGAIFRGKHWVPTGYKASTRVAAHARTIRIWIWKDPTQAPPLVGSPNECTYPCP